jgi:hypothetical protein
LKMRVSSETYYAEDYRLTMDHGGRPVAMGGHLGAVTSSLSISAPR